jgi:hypothetical protein
MQLAMSQKSRDLRLNALISEAAKYDCKVWAVIMESNIVLMNKDILLNPVDESLLGALSNQYCYLGVCNDRLYFSIIKTLNVEEEKYSMIIPFSEIEKVEIKSGIITKRRILVLHFSDGDKLRVSVTSNAIGTDIKDQKENADRLFELVSKINNA